MASSAAPVFAPGVWGPYYGAMFEGLYLNEGGQSAAGKLLDHLIDTHPARAALEAEASAAGVSRTAALDARLAALARAEGAADVALLAADVHVTPDFAGNRSPRADPRMRGGVVGLALGAGLDELARLYLAAAQALAYQTRQIVDALEAAGHAPVRELYACGGLAKNALYVQAHADALRAPVYLPAEDEAVLLGAAILGAAAGGAHASVGDAMAAMTAVGGAVYPNDDAEVAAYHERKYAVFVRMADDQAAYRAMMEAKAEPVRSEDKKAAKASPGASRVEFPAKFSSADRMRDYSGRIHGS